MTHCHQRTAGFLLGGKHYIADWRRSLDRLDGSYSSHTSVSYRSDFGSFETWYKSRDLKYLRAAPST